jgi:hypothetical protein
MPSPVDLPIWLLSRTMGWSGRRVATEVGVSQPTVVRTLERLTKEPPTEQEISELVNVSATPPRGIPVLPAKARRSRQHQLPAGWVLQAAAVLLALAVVAVLAGLTARLLSPPPPPPGQIACLRYAPNGDIAEIGPFRHGTCPRGEYAVTIVQNP